MLPLEPNADLNWAIWGPSTEEERCDLDAPPIRCSKADRIGPTGLSDTADDNTEDESGDGLVRPIPAVPFRIYTLFVYASGTADPSFELTFQNEPANLVNCEGLPTDITSNVHEGTLVLLPNPALDHITLSGDGQNMVRSWELTNAVGAVLRTGSSAGGGITIDVSALSSGAYLLRAVNGDGTTRQFRWVKQ
jgi:hypothetical protein